MMHSQQFRMSVNEDAEATWRLIITGPMSLMGKGLLWWECRAALQISLLHFCRLHRRFTCHIGEEQLSYPDSGKASRQI
jgi:hypothetical protein